MCTAWAKTPYSSSIDCSNTFSGSFLSVYICVCCPVPSVSVLSAAQWATAVSMIGRISSSQTILETPSQEEQATFCENHHMELSIKENCDVTSELKYRS